MKGSVMLSASFFGLLLIGGSPNIRTNSDARGGRPVFSTQTGLAVNFDQAWDLALEGVERFGDRSCKGRSRRCAHSYCLSKSHSFRPQPMRNQILKRADGKDYIHVDCRYETKGKEDQYRDLTFNYPREVMKLEEDIYRRIEPLILSAERVYVAETAARPGEASKPAPAELPLPACEPQKSRIVESSIPPAAVKRPRRRRKPGLPFLLLALLGGPAAFTSTAGNGCEGGSGKDRKFRRIGLGHHRRYQPRSGRRERSGVVTVLRKGEGVQWISQKGSWVQVKLRGENRLDFQ